MHVHRNSGLPPARARRALVPYVLAGALALGLAACTPAPGKDSGSPGADATAPAADVTKDEGEQVTIELLKEPMSIEGFAIKDLDGKPLATADWKGKVVVVNFWATWCGPCRAEIPDLVALQQKYRDHLVVVGISEDEGPVEGVRKFAEQYKVNYPVAMTTPDVEKQFPGIVALPTTFFLDKEGKIAQKHVGMLHARETEATARLLAGLPVNAEVKKVDDPNKVNAEDIAQMKEIPGVDLASVPDAKRAEVLQALNSENCTCGCGLTVAKCRIDDPSCTVSPEVAKKIIARIVAGTAAN